MDRRASALGHGALQKRDASKEGGYQRRRLPKKESDGAARLVWLFLFATLFICEQAKDLASGRGHVRLAQDLAYPNYEDSLEESFVYLENKGRDGEGDYTFGPRTFEGSARKGRWLVLDSGDLGDDGDVDLVLGLLVGLFARGPFRKGRPRRWERRFQPRGRLRPAVIVADLPHPGFRGN